MKYKLALVLVLASALSGCGRWDRSAAYWSGKPTKMCVDNVTYLQFTSGATIQRDLADKPVPCKEQS